MIPEKSPSQSRTKECWWTNRTKSRPRRSDSSLLWAECHRSSFLICQWPPWRTQAWPRTVSPREHADWEGKDITKWTMDWQQHVVWATKKKKFALYKLAWIQGESVVAEKKLDWACRPEKTNPRGYPSRALGNVHTGCYSPIGRSVLEQLLPCTGEAQRWRIAFLQSERENLRDQHYLAKFRHLRQTQVASA